MKKLIGVLTLCFSPFLISHSMEIPAGKDVTFTDRIGVYSSSDAPSTYLSVHIDFSTKYAAGKLLYKYKIYSKEHDMFSFLSKIDEELKQDFGRYIEPENLTREASHYEVHLLDQDDFVRNTILLSLKVPMLERRGIGYFESSGHLKMSVEDYGLIEHFQLEGIFVNGFTKRHFEPVYDVSERF